MTASAFLFFTQKGFGIFMAGKTVMKNMVNKIKSLKDNPKVQKWAIRTVPFTLCLTILLSYQTVIRSYAEENKIEFDSSVMGEEEPSILDPVTEHLENMVQKGVYTTDMIMGSIIANAFKLDVSFFSQVETGITPTMYVATNAVDVTGNYDIKESKILNSLWTVGCILGIAIATVSLFSNLFIMAAGGANQIRDNPLFLVLRYTIALFCILKSDVLISAALEIFDKLWELSLGLIIKAGATGGDNGLFATGAKWNFATSVLGVTGLAPSATFVINTLIGPFIFIKMVITFVKVFKSLIERYLIFMFSIVLAPTAFGCGTSKMTSKVLGQYAQLVLGEFAALLFDAAAVQVITLITINGFVWQGVVSIIIYFALCKVAVQMDTFMSKMGFNIVAQGGQLARSIAGAGSATGRMLGMAMLGRREGANIGKQMLASGLATGNKSMVDAGSKISNIFGSASPLTASRSGQIDMARDLNRGVHSGGEVNIASVVNGGDMSVPDMSRFLAENVGVAGHIYGNEMAQKGISISDNDRFINMGNGNIQHLDKDGNIKSAIVQGQIYDRNGLNATPAAKSVVDKFNREHDADMAFTRRGVISNNNEGLSNYEFLKNQGASEARARDFVNSIGDQKVASITGDGYGGFIARDDKNLIIGGMDSDGVMTMDKINANIYDNNTSHKYGEVGSSVWDDEAGEARNTFEATQRYTENAGCVPEAQRELASKVESTAALPDPRDRFSLERTVPVYLGADGKRMAFVSREDGNAVAFVNGSKVYYEGGAQRAFDMEMEKGGNMMRNSIIDRIKAKKPQKDNAGNTRAVDKSVSRHKKAEKGA